MSRHRPDPACEPELDEQARTSGILASRRPGAWPGPVGEPSDDVDALGRAAAALVLALADAPSACVLAERFAATVGPALPGRSLVVRLDGEDGASTAAHPPSQSTASNDDVELEVVHRGRAVGRVQVGSIEGRRTTSAEFSLLRALVAGLGLGLEALRARRERDLERARIERLVEKTAAPAFLLDGDGTVRVASGGAAELLGTSADELIGRSAIDVIAEGTAELSAEGFRRARSGDVIERLEMNTAARGRGLRVIWTAVPAHDADGEVRSILAVGKDLTAVAQLEDQIVHAEKLATLGQLAAGVVHELNNPLTSITVYTDYLLQKGQRSGGDPADLERLRRIAESAARMLRFTRDLVTYARPSTEAPTAVSIGDVLVQSAGFCEHVLRETNVEFRLDVPSDVPPVRGLRGQLQQVFVNLYTNAAHAIGERNTGPGTRGGRIEVKVVRDGGEAVVRVSDDGPGIREEHRSKIFEPFFSTKTEGKGTGLGLSIVRNIVRLHGGSMDVESRHAEAGHVETGTTFVLRLPLEEG